jgi:hypothetical protein
MKSQSQSSIFLIFLLLFNFLCLPMLSQEPQLRILIVEGDGAINNIKQRVNVEPVVEVRDENQKLVEGAAIVFFLPAQGPSGTFSNGSKTLTTSTDRLGRAMATGIHPNTQTGRFDIRVSASYRGQTASAVITQTNISGAKPGGGGMSLGTKAWIILAICGGAVAGGVIAATHKSSSSSSSGPPPIVITPGTPTVGAPK